VPLRYLSDLGPPRVPALVRSATEAPSNGWTAQRLQQLLDHAGAVCVFPGGIIDLPEHTRLLVPHGMRIDGNGTTLRVRGKQVPTQHLIDASGLGDGAVLEVHDLAIEGPDTSGWDPMIDCNRAAICWSLYRTWNATMIVRNVRVSGGYGTGVLRSGGGTLDVAGCDLGGWVIGLSFFESHGGYGSLHLSDTVLRAPDHSKYDSVGAYLHPHLGVIAERVIGTGWNRFVIYLNGTPQSRGTHQLVDVTAVDCSLVQTGSDSTTLLTRCREWGTPANGGSYLKGPVLSQGSRWEGSGLIGVLSRRDVERRFVDDEIAPSKIWMALGDHSAGTVVLERATVRLDGRSSLLKLVPTSTAQVRIDSSSIQSRTTNFPINVEGGSVELVRTARPPNCRRTGTGRLVG
jgi:hypothetical protein